MSMVSNSSPTVTHLINGILMQPRRETATQALSATIASGIRSIFAYSHAPYFTKWDSKTCELSHDIMPRSSMAHFVELARSQPYGNGRVQIGFGFDYWFMPKEAVVGIFSGLRDAGVKLFTSHYAKNPVLGEFDILTAWSSVTAS